MAIKTYILSGVAAIALVGVTPSFAQNATDTGPQYSTPAEQAQTQQLNSSVQGGTTVSPAALNGDAQGATMDQAHRDAQNAQYQNQQEQYQDAQAHYQAQKEQYERDIHHYDEARYHFTDYPHSFAYNYDDHRLRRLYLLASPSQQLANAPIEGPSGEWVGRVRNVEIGVDGRPSRVEVALNRRVSVWVNPGDLRFDADDHILFTNLTRADLWNMPGSTYESRGL